MNVHINYALPDKAIPPETIAFQMGKHSAVPHWHFPECMGVDIIAAIKNPPGIVQSGPGSKPTRNAAAALNDAAAAYKTLISRFQTQLAKLAAAWEGVAAAKLENTAAQFVTTLQITQSILEGAANKANCQADSFEAAFKDLISYEICVKSHESLDIINASGKEFYGDFDVILYAGAYPVEISTNNSAYTHYSCATDTYMQFGKVPDVPQLAPSVPDTPNNPNASGAAGQLLQFAAMLAGLVAGQAAQAFGAPLQALGGLGKSGSGSGAGAPDSMSEAFTPPQSDGAGQEPTAERVPNIGGLSSAAGRFRFPEGWDSPTSGSELKRSGDSSRSGAIPAEVGNLSGAANGSVAPGNVGGMPMMPMMPPSAGGDRDKSNPQSGNGGTRKETAPIFSSSEHKAFSSDDYWRNLAQGFTTSDVGAVIDDGISRDRAY